jgi:hypothetical protein
VNDCLVWLSANRVTTVAFFIAGGLVTVVGLGALASRARRD